MFPTNSGGAASLCTGRRSGDLRLLATSLSRCEPGDLITLSGDLGAGKTTFARALIRYLAGDETYRGPEPNLHPDADL